MLVGAGIGVTPCSSIMKGVVNYRWKKGFSPHNLHFYWVARRADLITFRWLVLVLPELKAATLRHNRFYDGDTQSHDQRGSLQSRLKSAEKELSDMQSSARAGEPPSADGSLPDGWIEQQAADGRTYYWSTATGATSWERPVRDPASAVREKTSEVHQMREALKMAAGSCRQLTITLFLTGCKKEEVEPQDNPEPGSIGEIITELQKAVWPESGEPLVRIRAGRPDWDGEFSRLKEEYRRENIGVVFCGAAPIANALKKACELHSDAVEGTIFKLHKENF